MAKEQKAATPAKKVEDPKKAELKAKWLAKKAAKDEALKKVLAYVQKNAKDPALQEAVKLCTPGARFGGPRQAGPNKLTVFAELFTNKTTITEDEIWAKYKLGRKEMRWLTVDLIKRREPKDRIWVNFNSEKGIYEVQGFGAEAPKGWTGYTPVKVDDEEIV